MADIVVFGAGAIAEVATVYLQRDSPYRIVGYTADAAFCKAETFFDKPVVPWETLETVFPPSQVQLLGPLSFRRMNQFRRDRYLEGKARGYSFITFVHPSCHVYAEHIGENCFILEQNVIQPFVRIGNNVMMWSGNHIGHHSVIGDHCFISSQVDISGGTVIGERCFLGGKVGIGAGRVIGNACFFGESTVIIQENAPDGAVYLGTPTLRSKHDSSRLAQDHLKAHPLEAAETWTRRGLLVTPPVGRPRWVSHAQVPTVLAVSPDCWRVYFAGRDGANCSRIFYADLDPGDDFRLLHLQDQPLLECGEPGRFDVHGMAPAAALRVGEQVWLYYTGIAQRRDVPYELAVGLAVSDDGGQSFRRACPGPVMAPGPHDPYFVSSPSVWRDGTGFRAVYCSATRWVEHDSQWECCYELRQAQSDDGVGLQPACRPGLGLAGGEAGLGRPCVLAGAAGLRVWFSHRGLDRFRSADGDAYRLQGAQSTDGRHWLRDSADLAWAPAPATGDWDGWMQAYPCVVERGDELIMFYNGNDFGRGGFGWASASRGTRSSPIVPGP